MPHENAVLVDERHDVGDRADRGQADRRHEEVPHGLGHAFGLAGPLANGPGQLESHARTAQSAERIARARQARMDDRRSGRQFRAKFVMIGDDQLQADFARRESRLDASDAAIDADHQRCSALGQRPQRVAREPVAFFQPIGHVVRCVRSNQLEAREENRRRGHAVGIVVAIDDNLPPGLDGGINPLGRVGDAGQHLGVAQARQLGLEKRAGRFRLMNAADQQQLGDNRRHTRQRFQAGNAVGIVRHDAPPLARSSVKGLGHIQVGQVFNLPSQTQLHSPGRIGNPSYSYFFFSECSVCLRSRGEYFFSFSFSPPGLRRRV